MAKVWRAGSQEGRRASFFPLYLWERVEFVSEAKLSLQIRVRVSAAQIL